MADITANLPHGIEPTLVADQAVSVDVAINDFMTSLWQAIVIILVCSFVSLGGRPGAVVALAIPLTLAVVFAVMDIANIDLHRISLGALIIALGLLVDDAMTTVDAMLRRLGAGDSMDEAATFSYRTLAAPMLIGALVTIASFVPIGFAKSNAGEYTFDIFSVVAISLIASWLVAVVFGPLLGKAILKAPKVEAEPKPSKMVAVYSAFLQGAIRARWLTIGLTLAAFVAAIFLLRYVPQQFFPASDRSELTGEHDAAAERLDLRHRGAGPAPRSAPEGRSRHRPLQHLCRPRRDPFHPDPRRATGQSVLRPVRDRHQGHRGARADACQAGKGARRAVSRGRRARLAARTGAAGRLAAAVSRDRPGQGRSAPNRARSGAGAGFRHPHTARELRLDGASPAIAGPRQPGPGAAAGHQFRGTGHRAQRQGDRLDGHAGTRRHLSGQCRGARGRRGARLVRDAGFAAGADAERAHGAAEPVCDGGRGAGIPARLAPRPPAHPDRARRRKPWHPARFGGRRARAEDRRTSMPGCRRSTRSKPVGCTRRARSRELRCSRSCR
jgi:hypothetical protein